MLTYACLSFYNKHVEPESQYPWRSKTMKDGTKMYSHERKFKILDLLNEQDTVNVNDLAVSMNTSKETIRRDLRELEDDGNLTRIHGGAKANAASQASSTNPSTANDVPFAIRHTKNIKEKKEICKRAASFIKSHDTIFLDNSSTTLFLPQYIPKELIVTIITNSIKVLLETSQLNNPNLSLIALAGFYNVSNFSVYGSRTVQSAEDFYPNKAFLSCTGINPTSKLTDISLNEVDIKKAMINKSDEVFLLADHTKFNTSGPFYLSELDILDYIVTDRYQYTPEIDANIKAILSKYNISFATN